MTRRSAEQGAEPGPWVPLRHSVYRSLWIATLASNIGTWMQEVGAAWLMTSLAPSPLMVSLVRAAASLPMFVLALPAGVIADLSDRRRLLLGTQAWMLGASAALGLLTVTGLTTPWLLLLLTFLMGIGGALNAPAWQAMMPELVPREELPAAISLNSMAFNIARASGPALAGLLIAAMGVGTVFLLNAISFLGVIFVLYRWRRVPPATTFPAERMAGALRTGLRYLRHAPELRTVLVRAALFIFGASALWALLPFFARSELGKGPAGYGALLAAFGAGAVAGASLLPRLRRRIRLNTLVLTASLFYATALLGMAFLRHFGILCIVMAVAGGAWLSTLASFNTSVQTAAPTWVRARALSGYLLVFFAGMALGSAFWGAFASRFGLTAALVAAAGGLLAALPAGRLFPLVGEEGLNLAPSIHWPAPRVESDPHPERGPVMIQIEYRIDPARASEFRCAMTELRRIRRRDGAMHWGLFGDLSQHGRFVESYLLESWADHLRQHERQTMEDRQVEERVRAFHLGEGLPTVGHYLSESIPRNGYRSPSSRESRMGGNDT